MKYYAVILAGGIGNRMNSLVPKQFLPLKDKPILMYSMLTFYNCKLKPEILLVLPKKYRKHWQNICAEHNFLIPHCIISGGETRFHSVKNALDTLDSEKDAIIAVHDAARPLASSELVLQTYKHAASNKSAVPVTKCNDSLRIINTKNTKHVDRDIYYQVQTPQCFSYDLLFDAYKQPYREKFTDDAAVVESMNNNALSFTEGETWNIKITLPQDLLIAEAVMSVKGKY